MSPRVPSVRELLVAVSDEALGAELMAPTFAIEVDGTELATDITQHVLDVEYEHTLDIASMLVIAIENREGRFGGATIFEPGQEINLYMGYAGENEFVGRAEIVRHLPRFPTDEFPVLELRGYDRSWRMGDTDVMSDDAMVGPAARRPKHPAPSTDPFEGARLHQGTIGSVVEAVIKRHGIAPDIDKSFFDVKLDKLQPKEMSDIEFIRGIAAIFDGRFWVDWDNLDESALLRRRLAAPSLTAAARIKKGWTGHFWPLERTQEDTQGVKFEYAYDAGEDSSIINIELDWGLPTTVTEMQVWLWNEIDRRWELVVADPLPEAPPEKNQKKKKRGRRRKTVNINLDFADLYNAPYSAAIEQSSVHFETDDPTRVKLGLAGNSVRVRTPPLLTVEEALIYARTWFHQNRNNFVFARGKVIGEPLLRAGQVHTFSGLGDALSGDYQLTSVRHRFSPDDGYFCTFTANKVLPNEPVEGRIVPPGEFLGGG